MLDLIIKNGRIVDGMGAAPRVADIGVRGDKIAAIGNLKDSAAAEWLDADGMVVSPGFIDIHTHSDFSLMAHGSAESQILQGVTLEVVGNCGHSCAPLGKTESPKNLTVGYESSVDIDWSSFDGYLSRLEKCDLGVNCGLFCRARHIAPCRDAGRAAPGNRR